MNSFKKLLEDFGIWHFDEEPYPSIDDPDFKHKAKIRWMRSQEEIPLPSGWGDE